MHTIVCPSGDE